jgi:diguanylate cyclase (GGDEF)-like protein
VCSSDLRKWELAREVQGRLNQLAFYDSLTGLPNRVLFIDRLSQALQMARRYERKSALLFIDMDNFKRINDTLGHTIGDDLLKTTAERLSQCLRSSDTVARDGGDGMAARLGGDEFTVVLPEIATSADAEAVARRISEKLARPMLLGGHQVIVTPSIGVALFPQDGESVEDLLKNADLAMYFAKRLGSNTYAFYDKSMNAEALKRMTVENHLRQAFERDEFTLHYQPQIDLFTGRLSGMEALLRWHNWELGNIPPAEFIPVAEECGLIVAIGEWVLRTACAQAAAWVVHGLPMRKMAVNVSVKQFLQSDFLDTVRTVLSETGLAPGRLEIEITESILAQDPEGMDLALSGLRQIGVRVAVVNFGNGYSSLSRLKHMPIDCLKIDRSFVCGIDCDVTNQSIIAAILAMAEGMELTVIAEGVETTRQAEFLRGKQCRQVQGYLFSRPLSTLQAEEFLRQKLAVSDSDCGTVVRRSADPP